MGLDDFLMHITGEVNFRNLKKPGSFIKKGELLADIDQDGKLLQDIFTYFRKGHGYKQATV